MTSFRAFAVAVPALVLLVVLARADLVVVNTDPLANVVRVGIAAVGQEKEKKTGVQSTVERIQGDAATADFKFKDIPSPAKENLARKAIDHDR